MAGIGYVAIAQREYKHVRVVTQMEGVRLTGGARLASASSSSRGSYPRLSAVVNGPAATITERGAAPASGNRII